MKQRQNIRGQGLWRFVRRHPIPSVLGLWVVLLLLAGLSTATLLHIEAEANLTEIPPEPQVDAPSAIAPNDPQGVALSQYPTEQIGQRETAMPLVSFGAIALSCGLGCLALSRTVRPVPKTLKYPASIAPETEPPKSEPITHSVVVPKQQNHPLDWEEPSLADSLDLRQRRPLSHWL